MKKPEPRPAALVISPTSGSTKVPSDSIWMVAPFTSWREATAPPVPAVADSVGEAPPWEPCWVPPWGRGGAAVAAAVGAAVAPPRWAVRRPLHRRRGGTATAEGKERGRRGIRRRDRAILARIRQHVVLLPCGEGDSFKEVNRSA